MLQIFLPANYDFVFFNKKLDRASAETITDTDKLYKFWVWLLILQTTSVLAGQSGTV